MGSLASMARNGADLYWIEDRPEEQGRSALVHRNAAGHLDDLVPAPFSVRSRVHEYGGGAYAINDGRAWFINDADQCIYVACRLSSPFIVMPNYGTRCSTVLTVRNTGAVIFIERSFERDGTFAGASTIEFELPV